MQTNYPSYWSKTQPYHIFMHIFMLKVRKFTPQFLVRHTLQFGMTI